MSMDRRMGAVGIRRGLRGISGSLLVKPWSLIDDTNLVLALDARLGVDIDTGVHPWHDQSTKGNNFSQSVTSKQPAYVTVDGKPAVDFDGVDDSLEIEGSFTGLAAGSDHTIFCVAQCDVIASSNAIFELSDVDPPVVNTGLNLYRDTGDARLVREAKVWSSQAHQIFNTTIASVTVPEIWEVTHEDTLTSAWIDGVSLGTDGTPTFSMDALISGRIGDSSGLPPLDGKVFSILVYNTVRSAGDRTTLRNSLADVWGVTL